jgi:hypothetical protein
MTKAQPDINDTLRNEGTDAVRARHDKAWTNKANGKTHFILTDVHAIFTKWFGPLFDMATLDAVLAVTAAARLGGDAAWLLVISGSGNAKTETVSCVGALPDTHIISTIASQGALLSATSKKSKAKGATGGLLHSWKRTQLLSLATKITNIQNDRHMVTHGLWEWYPSNPVKLRLYSFRPQFYFDTNFDLGRLVKLCDRLGEINHELTHPPRRGLSKLEITSEDMSYMSREAAIIFGGHDPAKYGIYMPGLPKARPPHVVP